MSLRTLLFLLVCVPAAPAAARDFIVERVDAAGPGSLRAAIADANRTPGPDRIVFAAGVSRIHLDAWLLTVTDPLEIDGAQGEGRVEVVAPARAWPPGLQFSGHADGSRLRRLRLSGFATAVEFDGCDGCRIEQVRIGKAEDGQAGRIGIAVRNSRDVVLADSVEVDDVLIGVYCEHSPGMTMDGAKVQAEVIPVEDTQCAAGARTAANAP